MINIAFPDAWSELALVTIQQAGAGNVEYAASLLTVDIDQGDKEVEVIPNLIGGRIIKFLPEEPTVVTLEGHFVELDTTSSNGIHQLFHNYHETWDTSEPLSTNSALWRTTKNVRFQVSTLWTNDTAATSAAGATAASTDSLRFYIKNAFFVSAKDAFTDGILKTTVKFRVPPFAKAGGPGFNNTSGSTNSNIVWDSGDNTALAALTTLA